jgi:predicted nucleic acid-binding protein
MLLDTAGLFNLLDQDEAHHKAAHDHYRKARSRLTHNYILAELIPLARSREFDPAAAIAFVEALADDPAVTVIWVDASLHQAGLTLLAARPDKGYSLCDAVSFVLMRRFGTIEALTTDRHFEQEGFIRLLI